ncbi:MAG: hypothetical protein ACRC1K_01625 [Planctomycetia bacterium]
MSEPSTPVPVALEPPAPVFREPYPTWILVGMDLLAAGILVASFRDAWSVVRLLGDHQGSWVDGLVAGAVVLAIDASILLLEQARSHMKLRGGNTFYSDVWVIALIVLSAILNVRYLTAATLLIDQIIGAILGVAIPSTIAVLGYLKGDMMTYNACCRREAQAAARRSADEVELQEFAWAARNADRSTDRPVDRTPDRRPAALAGAGVGLTAVGDDAPNALFRLKR